MVEPIFDFQFRLILIGDSTVGKSSLLKYFTDGKFSELCDPTVGVDFFARLIEVKNGIRVKLQLWDTAGQERFRSITRSYYRNSVGVLIVFDITKRQSFENITGWLAEAKFHIEPHQAVYMIVGHKSDCESERQVSSREASQFAQLNGLKYIETSAKNGHNVEETFQTLAKDVYKLLEEGRVKMQEGWDGIKPGFNRGEETVHHLDEEETEKNKCC
ncbi:ras-related protein Rab-39B-like [Ruditapes philippinarum]|uniref:ras-related protein Rab-39B-like n=1 Tax=Ruditapes philippinarum TaxID=129788 RepID=UPI00295ACF21|nr:ras-related protein Rab-39B-like [Ruditapes philippinarum]